VRCRLSSLPGATPMPTFTYLYLPTDDTKPVEEHTLQFTSKSEVGCLISHLSERFAMVAPKSEEAANSMAELLKTEAQRKGIDVLTQGCTRGALALADGRRCDTPGRWAHTTHHAPAKVAAIPCTVTPRPCRHVTRRHEGE